MPSVALQRVLTMLRQRETTTVSSIHDARQRLEAFATLVEPLDGVEVAPTHVGGVSCEWVAAPGVRDEAALLYLHGGGYGLGSVATHRALVSRLSHATGLRALTVDYRLAPEHPFPAAIDDATAVYRALIAGGAAPDRLIVAGDSAGGGLALAMMLGLREMDGALPAAAVCLSPWVDLDVTDGDDGADVSRDPMVKREELRVMAGLYLAGADPRSPLASPLHGDLAGLPPLLVQVGTAEVLLDDAVALAARIQAAGGEVTLEEWRDMIHVWHAFAPLLPEADEAIARIGGWVRDRLEERAMRPQAARSAAAAAVA